MGSSTTADLSLPIPEQERDKRPRRLPLIDQLLADQGDLSAVERFSQLHDAAAGPLQEAYYRDLLPITPPGPGQQYAFEVDLDLCSGCKACVSACHRLNGLEPGETWRSVGLLHGGTAHDPIQKTVTTACHHCLDPACMNGCPVQAYEKDPTTGIVKHLDDQCIGCQYCMLTCPYEVPQFSQAKGIVRKCDMCSDRLAEGEAPACVQACPNEAIAIRLVDRAEVLADAQVDAFLPGTPSPGITAPTTIYKTAQSFPRNLRPADFFAVRTAHGHVPLVVMLVLSQLSVGAFALNLLHPLRFAPGLSQPLQGVQGVLALLLGVAALMASTAHLGRPLYAYRALLGLRTSWMSREILVMGLFAGAATLYGTVLVGHLWAGLQSYLPDLLLAQERLLSRAVVVLGLLAIYTSVMLYHVTLRRWWHGGRTAMRFYGTAMVLGAATTATCVYGYGCFGLGSLPPALVAFGPQVAWAIACATLVKMLFEASVFVHLRDKQHGDLRRSAILLKGELGKVTGLRFLSAFLGGVVTPLAVLQGLLPEQEVLAFVASLVSLSLLVTGELIERSTFFTAMSAPRMPGSLP